MARLRGKIKYRPVVFELLPAVFTLLELQQTVEALAKLRAVFDRRGGTVTAGNASGGPAEAVSAWGCEVSLGHQLPDRDQCFGAFAVEIRDLVEVGPKRAVQGFVEDVQSMRRRVLDHISGNLDAALTQGLYPFLPGTIIKSAIALALGTASGSRQSLGIAVVGGLVLRRRPGRRGGSPDVATPRASAGGGRCARGGVSGRRGGGGARRARGRRKPGPPRRARTPGCSAPRWIRCRRPGR